ncbi:MAG TPA: cytochrome ubiquinol oxidase subunit I [Xanthomonadaceae bacterium]|jgi:cytochrome d ubiquinol oxidase subunit I
MDFVSTLDPVLLARLQFAFTISFHIIFPGFSIGLAAFVATLEILHWRTGREHYLRLSKFWLKVFAVSFAMGVVSGMMLSYEFGTNWSRFPIVVGNVLGPLLGYEVLTAFFLESTFLGILLFGRNRVPQWAHVLSACMVAIGTAISAFWILSANSWMHTPAGYVLRDGIAYPTDWWAIVFNPSFPFRLAHMLTAAYLSTSVVVLATGARYLLAQRFEAEARTMVRMGLGMVLALAPLQLFIGDQHGLNTLHHQPTKVAAMEAHWSNDGPVPLVLFAWPDAKNERNDFEVAIPHAGSLILTHSWDGRIAGLKDVPASERPPLPTVFFGFRIMVGIGFLLIAIGFIGGWLWLRGRVFETSWFLRPVGYAWPLGFIAIVAGWMVTETGRQPWIATGILRTADAVSPLPAATVLASFAAIVVIYVVVFGIGIFYIRKLLRHGPQGAAVAASSDQAPNSPLAAANSATREAAHGEQVT